MNKRDRFLEIQVGQYMTGLKPLLAWFAFYHRRLSNCHPEDYEDIRILERCAANRMIAFFNRHELLPHFTSQDLEVLALEWFQKVALKRMPSLEKELHCLSDQELFPRIRLYDGIKPSVPVSELADGYDFSWGLSQ